MKRFLVAAAGLLAIASFSARAGALDPQPSFNDAADVTVNAPAQGHASTGSSTRPAADATGTLNGTFQYPSY